MSGLRYQNILPLRWRQVEALPVGQESERIARDNELLLQLLPTLEEAPDHGHDEESPPRHIQMLELRLQLLTELLADLLSQARPLPLARHVEIMAEAIEWIDDNPPLESTMLMIELYLHRLLPRPLNLSAVVEHVETAPGGQRVICRLHLDGEAVQTELEKLIFRQHRRAVASKRQR